VAQLSGPAIARARATRRVSCDLRGDSRRLHDEVESRRLKLCAQIGRTDELRLRCSTWPSWGLPDDELSRVLVSC
jgi:hypothetical protein